MKKRLPSIIIFVLMIALIIGGYFYGIRADVVISGSMIPTYPVGSVVISKNVTEPKTEVKVQDCIIFKNAEMGTETVHRAVSFQKDGVITKGDNNNVTDGVQPWDNIQGKVLLHIPYLGYAVAFIKSKLGMTLIGLIIAALLIYSFWPSKKKV